MFERRSVYFAKLFETLGIEFERDVSGRIDNNKVLLFGGHPVRLYFNEATRGRGAYFAGSKSFYRCFHPKHWLEARNVRSEPDHFKCIPYPGEEELALRELLSFVEQRRATYCVLEIEKKKVHLPRVDVDRLLTELASTYDCFEIREPDFGGSKLLLKVDVSKFLRANEGASNPLVVKIGPAPRRTSECVYLYLPGHDTPIARSGSSKHTAKLGLFIGGRKIRSSFEDALALLSAET